MEPPLRGRRSEKSSDAVGSGRKQLYEGKEYDYVFDVDIQDGVPPLKLPYNANGIEAILFQVSPLTPTRKPISAAQRFLTKHDLPMTYLDEVVNFIEKKFDRGNNRR